MGGRDRGGRMSDMGPDKTDSDWRARPSGDSDDSHHRKDDAFGESESFGEVFLRRNDEVWIVLNCQYSSSHM